jgi:hypothetical protein
MLATFVTLAMAALAANHLVDVRSSTDCPSARNIAEGLRPLLSDGPAQGSAPDLATIEVVDSSGPDTHLHLRLVRADGAEVGNRRILVQRDCAEAASTVAAVIAAWETDPLSSAAPNVTLATGAPTSGRSATSSTWRLSAGVGGGVGLVGGVAGVGRIEALAGKSSSRLLGRVGFAGETTRSVSLSQGSVDWRHTTFEASVLLRTLHPVWVLSLDAGVALGWATLEGHGYSPGRTQRSFEYGAVAALRFGRNLGLWSVWAESRAYGWARGQRASVIGDEEKSTDLPQLDVTASVGLSAPLIW